MPLIEPPPPERYFDDAFSEREARRTVTPWLEVLRDVREHAVGLLERAFHTSRRDVVDQVLLGVFFRQSLVAFDATVLCLERFAVDASFMQLRALLETAITFEWISTRDEAGAERAVRAYHVGTLWQSRYWARRQIPGTAEHEEYAAAAEDVRLLVHGPEDVAKAQAWLAEVEARLAEPDLAPIVADFERHAPPAPPAPPADASGGKAQRKKPENVGWQVVAGGGDPRQMAKAIGRETEYLSYHRFLSYYVHASFGGTHTVVANHVLHIEALRRPDAFRTAFSMAMLQMQHVLFAAYERYRPAELDRFRAINREQWQPKLQQLPEIVVARHGVRW
jgi:hypothetical protein